MLGKISNDKRYNFILSYLTEIFSHKLQQIQILDIGCGCGEIEKYLGNAGCNNITGIDIDEDSINRARILCKSFPFDFKIENIESFSPSLPEKHWDCIICSEVIEHLANPEQFVANVLKLLKKDGRLFISIPNGHGPWERYHRSVEKHNYLTLDKQPCGKYHLQRFRFREFVSMMNRNGYLLAKYQKSNFVSHVWPFSVIGYHSYDVFERVDCMMANYIPKSLVSGWYFWFDPQHY